MSPRLPGPGHQAAPGLDEPAAGGRVMTIGLHFRAAPFLELTGNGGLGEFRNARRQAYLGEHVA
jgi:hypothetical protein